MKLINKPEIHQCANINKNNTIFNGNQLLETIGFNYYTQSEYLLYLSNITELVFFYQFHETITYRLEFYLSKNLWNANTNKCFDFDCLFVYSFDDVGCLTLIQMAVCLVYI